jgi:LacI family transcriptional regulator
MNRKRATLKDVALAVGVHISTVSRALNPATRHLITPETVERIHQASRDLGYRPNSAAYSLRTSRSMMVGVLVPDITNPIFPPIIRGVEDALAEAGYAALVINTDGRPGRAPGIVDALVARGVDGLVVASVTRQDETLNDLPPGMPVVAVNRRTDEPAISSVVNDDAEGVRQMLTHLVALGHRKILAISGNQSLSTGSRRHEAFLSHAQRMGLRIAKEAVSFASTFNEANGERCMEELIYRNQRFTAVMCANDRLAVGAIAALKRRGLMCPHDISVTGFNDMPMVDRIDPPLTTIRIQQYKVGEAAGRMLLGQMQGIVPLEPRHLVLPVELVVRQSSAPPPAEARKTGPRTVAA